MDERTLESVAILAPLPPKVRRDLIADAKHRTFAPGEPLVREGDSALNLFVVLSGHASIERAGAGAVGRVGPGDFFGELALIDDGARTATVVADDTVECLLIPAWVFRALLRQHPAIALPMLEKLIARFHRSGG